MKTGYYLRLILNMVAEEYEESVDDISSKCRRIELVQCRTMYCAVAWHTLHPALRQIAEPINRCETIVHVMILNHRQMTDKLYIAMYDKVIKRATRGIFGGCEF